METPPTTSWGPAGWHFLHSIAAGYPESDPTPQQREQYAFFFESLEHVLPCPRCAANQAKHHREKPIRRHLDTRAQLVRYVYDLHNTVNDDIGKVGPSFDEFLKAWQRPKRRPVYQAAAAAVAVALLVGWLTQKRS